MNNSFEKTSIDRTRLMRQWITEDIKSVADYGAGNMNLKSMLSSEIIYYPIDYTYRNSKTIVCDFNKYEFPNIKVDCCYCDGIIEYIKDIDWLLQKLHDTGCNTLLISYNIKNDFDTIEKRNKNGYVNNFTFLELLDLVYTHGFILSDWNREYDFCPLLKFVPSFPTNLQHNYFCTGCGACVNSCNNQALKLIPDENGFLKPIINKSLCINCGNCISTCPILNKKIKNDYRPLAFMAMADDETRQKSSNGGAFSIFSREAFNRNGVVFGASWDSDFSVHHINAENEEELSLLRKSKYLQSNIEYTFQSAKKQLDTGRYVLFSGTPCQIQGLKLFLSKEYENLITIDILCHYVPSPKVFQKYLDENFGLNNISSFTFREKEKGWNPTLMKIEKKDGSIEYRDDTNDYYQKGFHSRLFMNEACENCKFAEFPRVGDITIGDYWGGYNNSNYNDGKGTGEIIINSKKGFDFIDSVKEKFYRFEEIPLETTFENRIKKHYPIHKEQEHFLHLLKTENFNKSVERALERKFQIGLVGDWAVENYGANITYYALYQVLTEQLGYDVLLIERPIESPWKPKTPPTCFMELPYPKYAIELYTDKITMKQLNYRVDKFLVGSDQNWNNHLYNLFGKFIDLDWVYENKTKIAYAASFGADYIWGSEYDRAKMSLFMKKFDAFSVREKSGVKLAKSEFGIDAVHVLDPVFLCPKEKYIELSKLGGYYELKNENYLFNYILDIDDEKIQSVNFGGNILGLEPVIFTDIAKKTLEDNSKWKDKADVTYSSNVENWLAHIICCKYMITDSFHGMCLAIIFHKKFIAIVNEGRGATRFYSILEDLELLDRLVVKSSDITEKLINKDINWFQVDSKLEKLRKESFNWLSNALQRDKKASLSEYDLLSDKTDEIKIKLSQIDGFIQQRFIDIDNFAKGVTSRLDALDNYAHEVDTFAQNVNARFNLIDEFVKNVNIRFTSIDEYAKSVN